MPIQLSTCNRTRVFGVLLPGFDVGAEEFYKRLQEWARVEPQADVRCKAIPYDQRFLSGGEERITPLEVWDMTFGKQPRTLASRINLN